MKNKIKISTCHSFKMTGGVIFFTMLFLYVVSNKSFEKLMEEQSINIVFFGLLNVIINFTIKYLQLNKEK